ncbi:MAG: hypothetical protein APR54_01930 [Candidatus Cloacimonas sp. SDB]|nr:MAG: hypothetical protein APR54_01930 [Candidatus Cloacimonas sp. SDB]
MSLQPAFEQGFEVTRVTVTITRGNFIDSLNLNISGHTATGTFYDLAAGTYDIIVEVYDNETLIATGSGSGVVVVGETTTVNITLEFIGQTGNLEIVVDWGDQFPSTPERILFIGNSITYWNGGVGFHLQDFVQSADSTTAIECEQITSGGFSLQNHYQESTIEQIEQGDWDFVVLQERTSWPVDETESFILYATLFDSVITAAGAQTVFFFSWPYEDEFDTMIEDQAAAFNYISALLDAQVVPVARAWQLARQQDPDLVLFNTDGNHPSEYGTYLAICTFYAYFWNLSPEGIEYVNDQIITPEERDFLQAIAWQTYNTY